MLDGRVGIAGIPAVTGVGDQAGTADPLAVYGGAAPTSVRDLRPEVAGIHPVSAGARFGSAWSQLTLWFTPNVEVSGLFIASIAAGLGLGFGWGLAVLLAGEIAGTLVFSWMVTMGPRAGVSQLALARMPFGRSVVLPALVQALTAGGWIALVSLFGAQASSLLFGIPFAAGAAIVLAAIALVAVFGYQWIHQVEGWFAPVMIVLFGYLTFRILRHHITLPVQTVHGAALAGAVLLMLAIVLSGSLSWCPYAADFARRLPEGTSSRRVFGFAAAGTLAAGIWSALLGLAAANVIGGNQTAAGISAEVGGGVAGDAALVTIMLAAILSCCMNAYSSSLAFQAAGLPVKRPWLTIGISGAALGLVVWMQTGSVSGHFEDVLLLADYWVAPFVAIVMIDWLRRHREYTAAELVRTLPLKGLPAGWPALAAFVLGFGAMIPFMNTSLYQGPVSVALHNGDIAYPVGFAAAALFYAVLLRLSRTPPPATAVVAPTAEDA
jgi:nucleobase:cation symporter-1, NCS1 family